MKKIRFTLVVLFALLTNSAFAHYLWIQTNGEGKLNTRQEVRVYFGEYTYGITEKVGEEAFKNVSDFELWLIDPDGNQTKLSTTPTEEYYQASFTPQQLGSYTVYLKNDQIDVMDYTQYDFGIFKPQYQALKKVQVGPINTEREVEELGGLLVKELASDSGEVRLQVFYKGLPLAETETDLYMQDMWSKKLTTDANGIITFQLPFETKYILEVTKNEAVPGTFRETDYEFIWHCATYCLIP